VTGAPHLMSVLHAAELSGPPLFALRLLRWVREQRPDWTLSTVFLDAGGPLVEAFDELGPTVVRGLPAPGAGGWRAGRRLDRSLRSRLRALPRPDLVHVHCVGSMRVVPQLPRARLLCHVHEMSVGQDLHLGAVARQHLGRADHYVAVSDAARDELLARFDIDPRQVDRQWGFVDDAALATTADRAGLGAGPDEVLVVASGVRNWRKAPELFVRVAARAVALHPELAWRFVWVGGDDGDRCAQLAHLAGLDDVVAFRPHVADPLRFIAAADLFLLTAREDAFPLVCVEAAALGRPLVSFDSGGTDELIRAAGCGVVVPFPDVDRMAHTLAELAHDPQRRAQLGAAGADFARAHLTIAHAGPKLLATIESTMGRSR
jgi:glycosyltransferase involved in cell wall biosynthesis